MNKPEAIQFYLSKQYKARSEDSILAYNRIIYALERASNVEQAKTSIGAMARCPDKARKSIYKKALHELNI